MLSTTIWFSRNNNAHRSIAYYLSLKQFYFVQPPSKITNM